MILMLISMFIVGTGIFFAVLGVVFMYTGRAMSYDRAAKKIAIANGEWDRAIEEEKAAKAAKKAAKKELKQQKARKAAVRKTSKVKNQNTPKLNIRQ